MTEKSLFPGDLRELRSQIIADGLVLFITYCLKTLIFGNLRKLSAFISGKYTIANLSYTSTVD